MKKKSNNEGQHSMNTSLNIGSPAKNPAGYQTRQDTRAKTRISKFDTA
jgi:hypothetical protein